MSDDDIYKEMMEKIKNGSRLIKSGKWKISDFYFSMGDFFNQIEPSTGVHMGDSFNFKEDARELISLAKLELINESDGA